MVAATNDRNLSTSAMQQSVLICEQLHHANSGKHHFFTTASEC
jgi:hypothetical protein